MSEHQENVRDVVRQMVRDADISATALCRRAGLAPSTINKFLNGDPTHLLSLPTLLKLADAAGGQLVLAYLSRSGEVVGDLAKAEEQRQLMRLWPRLASKDRKTVTDLIESLAASGRSAVKDDAA